MADTRRVFDTPLRNIPVAAVGYACKGIVPREKRRHQPEQAAGSDDGRAGGAVVVRLEVGDAEQQKRYVEKEEEHEEGEVRAQGHEQQERREDEPSLDASISRARRMPSRAV